MVFDILNYTLMEKLVNQFLKTELKKVIVLIWHYKGGFTLKFNNCVDSTSFVSFVSNINYIFTPVNSCAYLRTWPIIKKN